MTNEVETLLRECAHRGLTLELRGGKLWIGPEEQTTPELVKQLREHKLAIVAALEARQLAAALHLAKQALGGEFDGCSPEAFRAVINELGRNPDRRCQNTAVVMIMSKFSTDQQQ